MYHLVAQASLGSVGGSELGRDAAPEVDGDTAGAGLQTSGRRGSLELTLGGADADTDATGAEGLPESTCSSPGGEAACETEGIALAVCVSPIGRTAGLFTDKSSKAASAQRLTVTKRMALFDAGTSR